MVFMQLSMANLLVEKTLLYFLHFPSLLPLFLVLYLFTEAVRLSDSGLHQTLH